VSRKTTLILTACNEILPGPIADHEPLLCTGCNLLTVYKTLIAEGGLACGDRRDLRQGEAWQRHTLLLLWRLAPSGQKM